MSTSNLQPRQSSEVRLTAGDGPYSEDELRKSWNNQADKYNQWDSLDSYEQLAWAQAHAVTAGGWSVPTVKVVSHHPAAGGWSVPTVEVVSHHPAAGGWSVPTVKVVSRHPAAALLLPPADGEMAELVALLQVGSDCGGGANLTPEQCHRAAALLLPPADGEVAKAANKAAADAVEARAAARAAEARATAAKAALEEARTKEAAAWEAEAQAKKAWQAKVTVAEAQAKEAWAIDAGAAKAQARAAHARAKEAEAVARAQEAMAMAAPKTEAAELADELTWLADQLADLGWSDHCGAVTRAAALLQRQTAPQSIPVGERPWTRDGWCDEKGECWMGLQRGVGFIPSWRKCRPEDAPSMGVSLPADALPLPISTENTNDR